MKEQYTARMLRIHFGEDDLWQGKPLYEAILAQCWQLGIPDAIAFRGIEGYGSASRIRHSRHWPLSKDAPIKMSVIGTDEQVAQLLPFLDAMVKEGLIATSAVEAIRYSRAPEKTAEKP
jgi:PII-like signaling protein